MPKLPLLTAKELIKVLDVLNFQFQRQRGSHKFFSHPDGRTTIISCHQGEKIDRGLLNKIVKKDLHLTREEFMKLLD